ncbi:probable leucine aminopeptidase 1 [Folsomia candida]|uniref:probable leucine aminopeptidase 1 n=1 Tax=Folsomia candida TaxID=158441 RepID=UPI001604B900|nr:probable leucine aminopeptidase 1 [Folsomia candida]
MASMPLIGSRRWSRFAIADDAYGGNVTVGKFTHRWLQSSIIARIEGADPKLKEEVVIFGAHLDSFNLTNPVNGRAPGSDDNGSGSVTLFESLRAGSATIAVHRSQPDGFDLNFGPPPMLIKWARDFGA